LVLPVAVDDVERVFDADAEGDRKGDEAEKVDADVERDDQAR
jgi:hypothetical protein